jgi:ABC-type glycerol-3-phosphate transport system permease component
VAFQEGYTISPILEAFVPKIIWSQKVRIPVGQFFNKQFRIVEGDEVYISPSHLGELYWNFGWSGVVLGMAVIGAICGWIGAAYNLAEFQSVTRVLVTVITIKQLIVSFESSISDCYVVWLRSLVGIALLHVAFARIRASSVLRSVGSDPDRLTTAEATLDGQRPFANLLT